MPVEKMTLQDAPLSPLQLALQQNVVRRAFRVALVVGTLLTLINQGPILIDGDLTARHWLQILLTYLVPYCVSTYSAVGVLSAQASEKELSDNCQLK